MPRLIEYEKTKTLNDRQSRFVDEYLVDFEPGAAALRVGYKNPQQGSNLLQQAPIKMELAKRSAQIQKNRQDDSDRVLTETARIAFQDPKDMYDEDGEFLHITEMPEDIRRAVRSVEMKRRVFGKGENKQEWEIVKVQLWDKNNALDRLHRFHALYKDKVEVDVTATVQVEYSYEDIEPYLTNEFRRHIFKAYEQMKQDRDSGKKPKMLEFKPNG